MTKDAEPCPNCGSFSRTPWIHAKIFPYLKVGWPRCFRYCRGCSTIEFIEHKDHRKVR